MELKKLAEEINGKGPKDAVGTAEVKSGFWGEYIQIDNRDSVINIIIDWGWMKAEVLDKKENACIGKVAMKIDKNSVAPKLYFLDLISELRILKTDQNDGDDQENEQADADSNDEQENEQNKKADPASPGADDIEETED